MNLFLNQKRFIQSSLVVLLLLSSTLWVQADESNSLELYGVEDYACAANLAAAAAPILENYENVMDQYMKVDEPTSEQFENAFMLYRYVEDSIQEEYQNNATTLGVNKSLSFSNEELSVCRNMRDQLLEYSRSFISIFISGASASKTTFEFVDGLKSMNADLKDMSLLFQRTFPGQFVEMSNALPCYAHQCLTQ
ncbi:hypothetical protein IPG41_06235 [Candidatus Peregrinibacteria bacterium]|nr:MAG: hypothetical protein IPG41_06235 [Candidatus Peregrinibacteria bacterium]